MGDRMFPDQADGACDDEGNTGTCRWACGDCLRGGQPVARERYVSQALQAYAALTTSADRGAVRDLSQLKGK